MAENESTMSRMLHCDTCGKILKIIKNGEGPLLCCGRPLSFEVEKSAEAGKEKHVPVVTKTSDGIRVSVGSIPHPMEPAHYIRWIEVHGDTFLQTAFLRPGEKPEKEFRVDPAAVTKVRAFCNVHGFWRS